MNALPCSSCPWRTNQTASQIPGYSQKRACGLLVSTVGDGIGIRKVMACHKSPIGEEVACRGYIARDGWDNLMTRILSTQGLAPSREDVLLACRKAGVKLHRTYRAVLRKLSKPTNEKGAI